MAAFSKLIKSVKTFKNRTDTSSCTRTCGGLSLRIKAKLLFPLVALPDIRPATILFSNTELKRKGKPVVSLTLSTEYIQLMSQNGRALLENGATVLQFPYECVRSVEMNDRKNEVAIIFRRPDGYFWFVSLKIKGKNRLSRNKKVTGREIQQLIQKKVQDIGNEVAVSNAQSNPQMEPPSEPETERVHLDLNRIKDSQLNPDDELLLVHGKSLNELTHAPETADALKSTQSLASSSQSVPVLVGESDTQENAPELSTHSLNRLSAFEVTNEESTPAYEPLSAETEFPTVTESRSESTVALSTSQSNHLEIACTSIQTSEQFKSQLTRHSSTSRHTYETAPVNNDLFEKDTEREDQMSHSELDHEENKPSVSPTSPIPAQSSDADKQTGSSAPASELEEALEHNHSVSQKLKLGFVHVGGNHGHHLHVKQVLKGVRQESGPFEISLYKSMFGLGVQLHKDELGMVAIKDIAPWCAMARDGNIRVGDYILSVNNTSFMSKPVTECETYLKELPKGKTTFRVMAPLKQLL